MFLRAAKTDAEEAGIETEGMAQSVAKLRDDILKIAKVDIMIDDNNFKSTYQILDEISKKWEDLADIDRANLLNLMGGKRNANVLSSIIENFDEARSAMEAAANAEGSALAENEKFLDSIAGHINKLTVAYEDLSQTVIDSDLVKVVVDGLTLVTNGLSTVIKNVGTLPTLISLVAGSLSAFKDVGIFHISDMQNIFSGKFAEGINGFKSRLTKNILPDNLNTQIKILTTEFKSLGDATDGTARSLDEILDDAENLGGQPLAAMFSDLAKEGRNAQTSIEDVYAVLLDGNTKGISNVSNIIKTFKELTDPKDQKEFAEAVAQTNTNLGAYLQKVEAGKASIISYGASLVGAKLKTVALTAATSALNAALSMGIGLLIQGAISAITSVYDEITNAVSKATEKLNDQIESVKTLTSELKGLRDELNKNKDRLIELNNLDNPNLFQQSEIDVLTLENEKLEKEIRIKELELEIAEKNKEAAAREAAKTYTDGSTQAGYWTAAGVGAVTNGILPPAWQLGIVDTINTSELDNFIDTIEKYKTAQWTLYGLSKNDTVGRARLETDIENYKQYLSEQRNAIEKILLELDPNDPANERYINELQQALKAYDDIFGYKGNAKTFPEIYELSEFNKVTSQLEALAKQGELTEETFNNVSGIEEFKSALESIGITETDEIIRAITERVKESGNAADGATGAFTSYAERLSKIKEIVDPLLTQRNTIQGLFDKISEGEILDEEDIQKLEEYPNLLRKIKSTTGGWTIEIEDLSEAYRELIAQIKDPYVSDINSINEKIGLKENQYQKYQTVPVNNEYEAKQLADKRNNLREEINDGKAQVEALNIIVESFNSTLKSNAEELEKSKDALTRWTSAINVGTKAQKEMQEQGHLSASTYLELIETADDYYKYIQIENGVIKFNYELFKEQSKAKLADEIATLELARAEALYNRNVDAMYGGRNHERLQAILDETELKLKVAKAFYEDFDPTWDKTLGDNETDTTDKDYQKRLDKLKEANKGTIEDEKKFVEDWTALNEEMYKATDPEKYEENLKEISDYIKGLNSLLDTYLDKWDKVHSYDDKNILSREARLTESRRVNYEAYGDPNSTFYNLDTYEKNIAEQAKYEADTLKIQLDRGLISYSRFISEINRIRENARDRDGNYLLDMSFVSDFKDADKQYEGRLENLKKLNDKSIADEEEYIRKWKSLNQKTYEGVDNTKYKSNLTEIVNYEKELLDRKYKEGLISAEEYHKEIVKLWEENKELLGEGTQTEWLEDMWKQRAETEKTYWEQQKDLASKYYDAEIKALQDVQKEEERISKAEELRLNLIKARQKLEEAKSQKNQLVFHDGTFEYMADQDAIMSAEEEVAESLKAIKENELQEQIDLLEQQRDEALLFYGNIIGLLEYYINGTMEIDSSDSSLIEEAMGSESGKYYMRLFNNEITPDEIRESYKAMFTKSSDGTTSSGKTSNSMITKSSDDTTPSDKATNSMMNWAKSLLSLDVTGIFDAATNFVSMAKYIGSAANGSTLAQDIATAATNNVSNKNETEIDNSVHVGDITMHIHGGTSEEMLNQFANKLGSAISTIVPKAVTAH